MEIPDVELVVERTAEADANEVGGEEGGNDLYAVVKAKGRSRGDGLGVGSGREVPKQRGNNFWVRSPPGSTIPRCVSLDKFLNLSGRAPQSKVDSDTEGPKSRVSPSFLAG